MFDDDANESRPLKGRWCFASHRGPSGISSLPDFRRRSGAGPCVVCGLLWGVAGPPPPPSREDRPCGGSRGTVQCSCLVRCTSGRVGGSTFPPCGGGGAGHPQHVIDAVLHTDAAPKGISAGGSCSDRAVRFSRPFALWFIFHSFLKLCAFEWVPLGRWRAVLHRVRLPKVPPPPLLTFIRSPPLCKGGGC